MKSNHRRRRRVFVCDVQAVWVPSRGELFFVIRDKSGRVWSGFDSDGEEWKPMPVPLEPGRPK